MELEENNTTVHILFKKIKNKPHTILINVEESYKDDLLKKLKKTLGCGGSLDDDKNISLQGDHVTKLLLNKAKFLPGMDVAKVDTAKK